MKNLVIANPRAAAGKVGAAIVEYERVVSSRLGECEVRLSGKAGGITDLVRESADEDVSRLVVIGGDGTVNEAINGLALPDGMGVRENAPPLICLPAGTGGDFARSIGTADRTAEEILDACTARKMDVGRISLLGHGEEGRNHLFMNIASFGVSAAIAERVNRGSKKVGGRVAFAVATFSVLTSWKDLRVRVRVDDILDREITASTIVVSNGRFFGGGMMVSPEAIVDDGLFDVVLIDGVGAFKFVLNSRRLYKGAHVEMEGVHVVRGREVIVEPLDPEGPLVQVETDGEIPGVAPAKCTLLPAAVEVYAPWDRALAVES